MKFSPLPVIVGLSCLSLCHAVLADGAARVIPRPQIEDYRSGLIQWEPQAAHFKVAFKNISARRHPPPARTDSSSCPNDSTLLSTGDATIEERRGQAHLVMRQVFSQGFSRMLRDRGALGEVTGANGWSKPVHWCVARLTEIAGSVQITACSDLGIYYGLCFPLPAFGQRRSEGGFPCPVVKIADWPEIGLRLRQDERVHRSPGGTGQEFAAWLPLSKMNVVGLQFHDANSDEVGPSRQTSKPYAPVPGRAATSKPSFISVRSAGKAYDFTLPRRPATLRRGPHGCWIRGPMALRWITTTGRGRGRPSKT